MKRLSIAVVLLFVAFAFGAVALRAQPVMHRLTVSQLLGQGVRPARMTTNPGGIDAFCAGAACAHEFPAGATVTITVDTTALFSWEGACAGERGNVCRIVMNGDRSAVADRASGAKLTYHFRSSGSVGAGVLILEPGGETMSGNNQTRVFPKGTELTIRESKQHGMNDITVLESWGGACAGQPVAACHLLMDGDKALNAVWRDAKETKGEMELRIVGVPGSAPGRYEVTPPSKALNDCRAGVNTCIERYAAGTEVTIRALGNSMFLFDHWVGGCDSVSGDYCRVKMSRSREVTAAFLDNRR